MLDPCFGRGFSFIMKWTITTLLRDGVKGTEEDVVHKALLHLGYDEITSMKMGQSFYLTLNDETTKEEQLEKIKEMCKKTLVNIILYDFKVELYNE